MARIQLPNLPPTITLGGPELLEVVQAGVSRKATVSQITDISNAAAEAFIARLASTTYVAQFATLEAFNTIKDVADYWAVGSMVKAGPLVLEKRLAADGSRVWIVQTSDPTRTLDTYLGNQEQSVQNYHIAKGGALTVKGNAQAFATTPQDLDMEILRTILGFAYYGDLASGGIDLPESDATPLAPSAFRCGRATSLAAATDVVFAAVFAGSVPVVMIMPIATSSSDRLEVSLIGAPTVSGFSLIIRNSAGTALVRDFQYLALGNGG